MSEGQVPASSGAVDLSSMGHQGSPEAASGPTGSPVASGFAAASSATAPPVDPTAPAIAAPLITEVTERSFEDVMALSQTVPVVLVLYTPGSLTSKQAITVMEDVARRSKGAFQLGKIDVEANPTLASAFQVQAVPAGVAVVARRPVPLFEGLPTPGQVEQILAELFQVAPQLGVVGRIEVRDEDLEKPMPPEHAAAREAEESGNWEEAIAAWKKVLANDPTDHEAKTALVRAQFEARQDEDETSADDSVEHAADELFAKGAESEAFDLLLEMISKSTDAEERDQFRSRLVELFQIATDKDAVKTARGRLATILMV
ncbi:tetratricopeptide repeat protein [Actinomycetaceae bacterium MB13-C1-2]|nr:tetratricopeptide repeat protein [Actinomycetaceae bacterium MB13-C1-2]